MCSRDRTRTYNLPVNSRTLCRLSYAGPSARRALGARLVLRTSVAHPAGCLRHADGAGRRANTPRPGLTWNG